MSSRAKMMKIGGASLRTDFVSFCCGLRRGRASIMVETVSGVMF